MTDGAPEFRGQNKDIILSASGPAGAYLATEFATAPPRRLAELLYDGAIRLCRQAMEAFDADDPSLAARRLARAGEIVRQLQSYLRGETGRTEDLAEACGQVRRRLTEAGFYRSRQAIAETLSLLLGRRDAWGAFLAGGDEPTRCVQRARRVTDWVG